MNNNSEPYYLQSCLKQIEATVDRGSSDNWATYDFEKLSDAIYEKTQVRLSLTTLKRVFGKLKYHSAPTLTTLNALVQYAGYADWRDFKQMPNQSAEAVSKPLPLPPPRPFKRKFFLVEGAVLVVALVLIFLAAGRRNKIYDSAQFEFTANKVISEGVPNSVIFRYKAGMKPDSLFIVQTWDIRRKTLVPADKNEHSAIYYYPGFFRTKLIADEQVMKTHDLFITSNGWLCLLEELPIPVYFKKEQCKRNGIVEVSEAMLAKHMNRAATQRVRFFNQRDMGDLMNDNFTFETKLKNDFDDGSNACHYTEVLIQCKNDIIIIPLAAKSCVGDLSLYFCGSNAESKSDDLSGFGCDLSQWTSLLVETVNKAATIFVNGVKAYSLTFPNSPTGIVGVQYRFNGAAAVTDTRFTANGKVYEMD